MKPAFTRLHSLFALAATAAVLSACGGGGSSTETLPPQVTMTLSNGAGVSGDIVITLEPTKTPVTTANFLAYVASGFYNNTIIHRYAPGFVVQGGGYATGTTPTLKATSAPIALEVGKGLSNVQWSVAMARTNVLDSATSQFFINLANNTALDTSGGGYAVFGTVTSGTNVITAITTAPCSSIGLTGAGECTPSPHVVISNVRQTR